MVLGDRPSHARQVPPCATDPERSRHRFRARGPPFRLCQAPDYRVGLGLFGLAAIATLRAWNAGPGTRDIFGTFLISNPVTTLLVLAYWRHHGTIVHAVAGPEP